MGRASSTCSTQCSANIALVAGAVLLLASAPAAAHDGPHESAASQLPWWGGWNLDLLTLASLGLIGGFYAVGVGRLWHSAGAGHGVSRTQAVAFAAGMLALVIALISPLDPLSDELSAAHMVQHMLLMMVAAPLFVIGIPPLAALWALPKRGRRALGRSLGQLRTWRPPWYVLWQPLLLFALFALTLWVWHLPTLYEAALRSRPVHELQHVMFFVTSLLFWRVLLDPLSRLRMSMGAGVLYLFLTSLHATIDLSDASPRARKNAAVSSMVSSAGRNVIPSSGSAICVRNGPIPASTSRISSNV